MSMWEWLIPYDRETINVWDYVFRSDVSEIYVKNWVRPTIKGSRYKVIAKDKDTKSLLISFWAGNIWSLGNSFAYDRRVDNKWYIDYRPRYIRIFE